MIRVPYYEEQILLAIPRLGKAGEDAERLRKIAPLFRDNAQATMAACMTALFPDKDGKAAVDAFKAFRARVEKAGREASPSFPLEFVLDENKRLGAGKRFCRIEGPQLDPTFRSLVNDVRDVLDLPNPAYLGKPKIRLVPRYRPHKNANAHKLLELLATHLDAHKALEFRIVEDVDQAELLLPLLTPALFADEELLDRLRGWSLEKTALPVGVEPFDESQSDGSFDPIQQFRLTTKAGQRSFSECDKGQQEAFALELFRQIDAVVRDAFTRGTWKTGLDWLGAWSERRASLEGDRIVATPAKRMPMHATISAERPVQYVSDGDAMDLLVNWAIDQNGSCYMAVLGEYGIGKTTGLKRFTLALHKKRQTDPKLPVPIYLDLRDGADGTPPDAPLEVILRRILDRTRTEGAHQTPRMVLDAVQRFGAVLIFDGLDERIVHMTSREAEGFIRELFKALPTAVSVNGDSPTKKPVDRPGKLIISCRSHYFRTLEEQRQMLTGRQRGGLRNEDCEALIILPFEIPQIRAYIDKALKLGGKQPERIDAILRLFASIHNLAEMAPRPVLLAMLVEQIDDLERMQARSGRSLVAADIYDRMAERWLERDGGKHKLKPDHKLRIMEGLAAFLWAEGLKQVDIQRLDSWFLLFLKRNEDIHTRIEFDRLSADVLEGDLRTGTFLVRPDAEARHFRFAHTSFQEYFLAAYLFRALDDGKPECWSLPMVSMETLNFLGQLLARVPQSNSLATLATILGGEDTRAAILAFEYWLVALDKDYPEPRPRFVNLAGANLEERTIRGRSSALPLDLRGARLANARLNRARLEHVDLSGADLSGLEARQSLFLDVKAPGENAAAADFRGLHWQGGSLAGRDLTKTQFGCQWIDVDLSDTTLPERWSWVACTVERARPLPRRPGSVLELPNGHSNKVNSSEWSPDGRRVVSASLDNSLKLWDAASGDCLLTLKGHGNSVRSCCWSPDGQRVVSGSSDTTLKVWDATSGDCLRTLKGHSGTVNACRWKPDGQSIVSGSDDTTLKVWDVDTGRCQLTLDGHAESVNSCTWSPDGQRVVSGSSDTTLKVWDPATGQCLITLKGHGNSVRSCCWRADGRSIVSGSASNTLKVWDVETGRCWLNLKGHLNSVSSCCWSPDGRRLVSGSSDHTLKVWDPATGRCLLTCVGHSASVRSCCWSPDGRHFVSGSADNTLKVWDAATGQCLITLKGHAEGCVQSCEWSPNGKWLAADSNDCTLRVWEADTGQCRLNFKGHSNRVQSCAWSPDDRQVVSASSDNTMKVWEVDSGKCRLTLIGHSRTVQTCSWSPDGRRLVSGSSDTTLKVWEANTGNCLLTMKGHQYDVNSCVWSPNSRRMASGSSDGTLKVWDAASGDCLLTLTDHFNSVNSCRWSPDGRKLVSGSYDNTLKVWDADTGQCLLTLQGHTRSVRSCGWSPNGRWIVSASNDTTLKVWDADTGQCLRSLQSHAGNVNSCGWSPDGCRLVSGSDDGMLKVWDAVSGDCLWTGHLLPDGQVASIDHTGNRVLYASPEAWRFIGWRVFDPEIGGLRLLPAEAFGPLPG